MSIGDFISEFARENKISRELAEQILTEAMKTIYGKKFGKDYNNLEVTFDKTIRMFQVKTVVENVEDPVVQITVADTEKIPGQKKAADVGETVLIPVEMEGFGRQMAQIVKQIIKQKITEIQKDVIYNEFKHRVGEMMIGKVKSKTEGRYSGYYVSLEPKDTEAFLPFEETIPDEAFDKGDFLKAILVEVKQVSRKEEAQLILSRTTEDIVRELLRTNIPEIQDGTFVVKAVARKAGEVSKVVMHSYNDMVDPVSVTIGKQGARIKPIRAELGSERIEIIKWSEDPRILIKNAVVASRVLKNRIAEVFNIDLTGETREASVVVPNEFIAPLIGKKGIHQKMLEKITGWSIHFVPYSEFEVLIQEKKKEIDQILGISGDEEVEIIEEEAIPIQMLPFTKDQVEILENAGFEDVADIIDLSIEDLAKECDITLDDAVALWKVIEDNVDIEDEVE
jgi:N utilization substance protein A